MANNIEQEFEMKMPELILKISENVAILSEKVIHHTKEYEQEQERLLEVQKIAIKKLLEHLRF